MTACLTPPTGHTTSIFTPFDLDLAGTETLREEERFVLIRLLATGTISEAQGNRGHHRPSPHRLAIARHRGRDRCAPAARLRGPIAAITSSGVGSPLVGTEALAIDPGACPALLARGPGALPVLSRAAGRRPVVVLAVNPAEPAIEQVVPGRRPRPRWWRWQPPKSTSRAASTRCSAPRCCTAR